MLSADPIRNRLERSPSWVFNAWAVTAAFGTYFCMYGFRKPFAVGVYEGEVILGVLGPLSFKALFVISQVIGYCTSKFLGIKVVSEMPAAKRAAAILAFIGVAELALVAFGLVPAPWNAVCLFFNGLPLGMIWGLVFSFMEGRKTSDLLGAGLCASFIVASGFVKSIGKMLLDVVPEYWMAAATGGLFILPLMVFVAMLAVLPPPSAEDVEERTAREPMDASARRAFVSKHGPGLILLVIGYVLLTAYRELRDNFAREIWDALGFADQPEILTTAELPVAIGSLLMVALLVKVRSNQRALVLIHGAMVAGALLVLGATGLYKMGLLDPATWMVSAGLGLYLGYVPFNCVLFDRLVAATRSVATAAFLIYIADAFGYLGSVGLMLYKDFGSPNLSWLDFFVTLSVVAPVIWGAFFAVAGVYFHRKVATESSAHGG